MSAAAVRFGVNYTPSEGWFHHWLDFDADSVRADLDSIAALGLDHIRVFPLWPYFQPNRSLVRPRAVEQLVTLVDAAGERGLDVNVDGLQGHLSSFDFLPAWTRTWHRRNLFTDPKVLDGQAHLLRTLAAALADRPNFLGMTLGNEINQFSAGPHPDPDRATADEIDAWLTRMLAACEEGAPGKLHLHAEYDATWYQDDQPFTPAQAARHGTMTAVHSWVFNGTAQRHGRRSVPTEHHAAYLIELSKAWADEPHRPVWLQEVGAPAPLIPPEDAAAFTEATIEHALDCPDLFGITWWCSHDVSRDLADFPELEYGLGLLTNDRTPKDTARVLARAAQATRAAEAARAAQATRAAQAARAAEAARAPEATRTQQAATPTPPIPTPTTPPTPTAPPPIPAPRTTALVVPADPATRSRCAPGGPVYDAFFRLTADGARPTTVLDTRATDPQHLAARGITEVVTSDQVLPTPQGGTRS